ncbi:hypothetical protein RYH73_10930 [Olivibacter sp. CPCC 100613]
MGITFQTSETSQTLTEYNEDLENGNNQIERGEFISATQMNNQGFISLAKKCAPPHNSTEPFNVSTTSLLNYLTT